MDCFFTKIIMGESNEQTLHLGNFFSKSVFYDLYVFTKQTANCSLMELKLISSQNLTGVKKFN